MWLTVPKGKPDDGRRRNQRIRSHAQIMMTASRLERTFPPLIKRRLFQGRIPHAIGLSALEKREGERQGEEERKRDTDRETEKERGHEIKERLGKKRIEKKQNVSFSVLLHSFYAMLFLFT